MLIDIKRYIKSQKRVSLLELSIKFDINSDVLHYMLKRLLNKGCIHKLDTGCNGCTSCSTSEVEIYTWAHKSYNFNNSSGMNMIPVVQI